MNVCSCHVTYTFQSESTLYICLNVRELLDCNWTRTQNHLVRKRALNHLAKSLSVCLQTKWFWVRVQLQLLKTIMQPFLHYLKIDSPPNKEVQTKHLVHYVLLRHLLYDISFEKLFISYYNFILLEC